MKETLNVNVGSMAFTIDDDAYRMLKSYLDDIRDRLPADDAETMDDIERRIAEFFGTDPTPVRLVTLLLILFGGLSIWIYVVLWLVIPEAPAPRFDIHAKKR